MKTKIVKILLISSVLFTSACSTEKKLHKAIQKHGIEESITYIVSTYPKYFEQEAITIKDTIYVDKIIEVEKTYDFTATIDSLKSLYTFKNDKVTFKLDKKTNKVNFAIKDSIVYKDTIINVVDCPTIVCPDIDKLPKGKDNNNLWYIILILIILILIFAIINLLKNKNKY